MESNRKANMKTTFVEAYTPQRKRKESLGLMTSPEFELKLLEGALKGKKTFDAFRRNRKAWSVQQQVLWYEISDDVKEWRKNRKVDLVLARARKLEKKLKTLKNEDDGLHSRALKLCNQFQEIQTPKLDSLSLFTLRPGKFDSAGSLQGEPSESVRGSNAESPEKSRSWEYPNAKESNEDCKIQSEDERDRIYTTEIDQASQPGSVQWSRKKEQLRAEKKLSDPSGWVQIDILDGTDDEIKYDTGKRPSVDLFKGNFEKPIQWKIGDQTYSASSIDEIRAKYDVQVEGHFEKRKRTWGWKNYYGFLIASGMLLYFELFELEKRKEIVFKKSVDFLGNSITSSKEDQLRFNVYSAGRNWPLKFATQKEFSDWYAAVKEFSRCPANFTSGTSV